MQHTGSTGTHSKTAYLLAYVWMAIGAFMAAFSIQIFFVPNNLIDGGVVGVAMILGTLFGTYLLPFLYIVFTLPFLWFAYKFIGKDFLLHMGFASLVFFGSLIFIEHVLDWPFHGDPLEVVVIGGSILGVGLGLIIRSGGCVDGTEILGIVVNKRTGFTVGQTVLACNVIIFAAAGLAFQDWHPPILSLITYIVVVKVMDATIVGLDETKSVLIISSQSKEITQAIIHELGLGLTIMYGRGGFSGNEKEILYVIVERLQLAQLKDLVLREDPSAFIAVESLHEVANGNRNVKPTKPKSRIERLISPILQNRP